MDLSPLCLDEPEPSAITLRDYQVQCLAAIDDGWKRFSRQLAVLATGAGKTVIFSHVAKAEVERGGRVLILAHTDELLDQAIEKLHKSTGLEAEKEKADAFASPYAKVVVASIQTLSRTARLTGFSDGHFSLVICDETHRALAKSYQKVLSYYHFGAESLVDGWKPPARDVPYQHKARVLGVTATASRSDKRSLGEFYQNCCFEFGLLEACREGYLVRPIVRNIPLKLDLRGVRKTAGDYDAGQVVERITPFLNLITQHIAAEAHDRKIVVFTPSVETARLAAEALVAHGIDASFVSGQCPDRAEKIEAFHAKGNGSAICNAMLLTEGWDHPEASCICVLRPTKIQSLFTQCVGRGTRTLPGVIDGLSTREARLAAIASSAKKDVLILDFLWLTDSVDLVSAVDLVATSPELKKLMKQRDVTDLLAAEEEAQKDLLKSLEKAAKKHQHKQPRTIDPLAWAVSLGDAVIASYVPENAADAAPPSKEELDVILGAGLDSSAIKNSGQAQKLIGRLLDRDRLGLASVKQLNFLKQLGVPEEQAVLMKKGQAGAIIGRQSAHWRR